MPQNNLTTRPPLLRKIKQGDNEAWEEFYARYKGLAIHVAIKAGLNQQDAEDLVQERMIKLITDIKDYSCEHGRFRNWFVRKARWMVLDFLRRRKREPSVPTCKTVRPEEVDGTSTINRIADPRSLTFIEDLDEEFQESVRATVLEKISRDVNPNHYQIYVLYVQQRIRATEVARLLGCTEGNVRLIAWRMKRKVASELNSLTRLAKRMSSPPAKLM